jgi:hypothetical protein
MIFNAGTSRESGTLPMEKPTIWSSRPDKMRRTVCIDDSLARRAQYGRIRPMEQGGAIRGFLARFTL